MPGSTSTDLCFPPVPSQLLTDCLTCLTKPDRQIEQGGKRPVVDSCLKWNRFQGLSPLEDHHHRDHNHNHQMSLNRVNTCMPGTSLMGCALS